MGSLEDLFSDDPDIPQHYIDPLTETILSEPCLLSGRVYERKGLEQWIQQHKTDPYSRHHADLDQIQPIFKTSLGLDSFMCDRVKKYFAKLESSEKNEELMNEFVIFLSYLASQETNKEEHYELARRLATENMLKWFRKDQLIHCVTTNCSQQTHILNAIISLVKKANDLYPPLSHQKSPSNLLSTPSSLLSSAGTTITTTTTTPTKEMRADVGESITIKAPPGESASSSTPMGSSSLLNSKFESSCQKFEKTDEEKNELLVQYLKMASSNNNVPTHLHSSSASGVTLDLFSPVISIVEMMFPELQNEVIKEGNVFKKSTKGLKRWTYRYLVLKKSHILLYKSLRDAEVDRKGHSHHDGQNNGGRKEGLKKAPKKLKVKKILLDGACLSRNISTSQTTRNFCFVVSDMEGTEKWLLQATSLPELEKWCFLIKFCIFNCK